MKRKHIFLTLAAGVLLLSGSAFILAESNWNIKTDDVKINFHLPKEGTTGTISGLKAVLNFDALHPESSSITATADVSTIQTDQEAKTSHLKSADFFDAEKHPTIQFTSTKITASDSGFVATGSLTMRDSTKTVSIPFSFKQNGNEGVFKGSMSVHPGEFGVGQRSKSGSDLVEITIEVPVSK